MMHIRELKESTASKISSLVDANSTTKVAKKISEKSSKKASLNIDFASQSLVISHSFSTLSSRNTRWNDAFFNDRSQRFHRDDYELNRDRSRSRMRDTSHELSITNSKFTYLQDISIVITIKQKKFRTSDIDYFYSNLSKETHALDDYVVSEKNIFYRDVYIFTQQVKRVAIVKHKDIRNKLHLCLREFFMILFINLDVLTRNHLNENSRAFCEALIRKYKLSNFRTFEKLIAKHYSIQDARK